MILGAFTLRLKVTADSSLPISHGRLLHAAFLDLVRQKDGVLSERLHDSNVKGFSTGTLLFPDSRKAYGKIIVKEGDYAYWNVTSIDAELSRFVNDNGLHGTVRIGRAVFEVTGMRAEGPMDVLPAFVGVHEIMDYAMILSRNDSMTFRFLTPTAFRYYDVDYPFPRPDFIFGSLAEKWNTFTEDVVLDVESIKQIAAQYLIPIQWNGESCRVNITEKKGVTGFVGTYTFSLRQLPVEHRQVMFTLALFAMYSGVGRLAAQGMGRVRLLMEESKCDKNRHTKHIK